MLRGGRTNRLIGSRGCNVLSPHSGPRRSIRVALDAEVSIRRVAENYRPAQLRDLSSHGCSVVLIARVNLDETVWIKLPGIEARQGFVCWVQEYTCGIEFDAPLHSAVMDMLAQRLGG